MTYRATQAPDGTWTLCQVSTAPGSTRETLTELADCMDRGTAEALVAAMDDADRFDGHCSAGHKGVAYNTALGDCPVCVMRGQWAARHAEELQCCCACRWDAGAGMYSRSEYDGPVMPRIECGYHDGIEQHVIDLQAERSKLKARVAVLEASK